MSPHKKCYGTMFHEALHFSDNQKMNGKVFGFELDVSGLARSGRHINVNLPEWDDCLSCQEFEHCYKLCMAKLALETAIGKS